MQQMKTASRLVLVILALLLAGCSDRPADVAEKFYSRLAEGKMLEARQYATDETMQLMGVASSFGDSLVDPDFDFQLVDEQIDGNRATVRLREKPGGPVKTTHLVRLNGKWKVHEQKQ